jgi:hypothetical protein
MPTLQAKDLAKEPPRSPRQRLGGYVILARTTDKCRALLAGSIGEFHFDCPLDNQLFGFKNVSGDAFKAVVEGGATDEEIVQWLDAHGAQKSAAEVTAWGDAVEAYSLVNDPEKRDFFVGECAKLGLVPEETTLFDWLEADDRASFAK